MTAVLSVLATGAWAARVFERTSQVWTCAEAAVVATAIPWTGGGHSALLPYLLAPGLALGVTAGLLDLLLAACLAVSAFAGSAWLLTSGSATVLAGTEWGGLALATGLLALWCRHFVPLEDAEALEGEAYRDVRRLLGQLRGLTRRLPAGLDAE
jgi:hypothetical protein